MTSSLFQNLSLGFQVALSLNNILYAFLGCLFGTLVGVLPGIGPLATIAMLLPATYSLPPETALIMLAGIYYGAQYGGSTTAIVVNLPGESSSVITAVDGYQMARKGRAGVALSTAAIGSFIAGSIATLILAALAEPLAQTALAFGAVEYFSLIVLGLVVASALSAGPFLEGIGAVVFGMLISLVGTDVSSGVQRFAFGLPQLADGLDFVPIAMGIFGFAEIVNNLDPDMQSSKSTHKISSLLPTREDFRRMMPSIFRATALGSVLGILPGGGAIMASFLSYSMEKKLSRHPEEFGHGAIEGVAGPESANNAAAQTSFIPLLTLGLPSNAVMALMMGAMMIHNVQPGPEVMTANPRLFWGLIASMWIGNLMLVILNLPLVGLWVKLLTIPYRYLFPSIMVFCVIGVFTLQNDTFEVYEAAIFGVVGYALLKFGLPAAPLLLGLVLGPGLEENFRRAMVISRGNASVFFTSPISAVVLAISAIAVIAVAVPQLRARRELLKE